MPFLGNINDIIQSFGNPVQNPQGVVTLYQNINNITVESSMDAMVRELDPVPTPFAEAFPNFNPGEKGWFTKWVDARAEGFSDYASSFVAKVVIKVKELEVDKAVGMFKDLKRQNPVLNPRTENTVEYTDLSSTDLATQVKSEIAKEVSKDYGPLDKVTVKQVLDALGLNVDDFLSVGQTLAAATHVLSYGLLLRTMIHAYSVHVYPIEAIEKFVPQHLQHQAYLARQIKVRKFSFFVAPVLSFVLYGIIVGIRSGNIQTNINQLTTPVVQSFIFFISFNKLNMLKYRNFSTSSIAKSSSNNKLEPKPHKNLSFFDKFYSFLIFGGLIITSYFFQYKTILFYCIIIYGLYLAYLIFNLYILLLYINNKITTPQFLPIYLQNWLVEKEKIAKYKLSAKRYFVDLEIKDILSYIVLLSLLVFVYLYF